MGRPHDSLHFSEAEILKLKPGSAEHAIVQERQHHFDAGLARVAKFFPLLFEGAGGEDSIRWGFSIIASRGYTVSMSGKEADMEHVLIPFVDFFNHDASAMSSVFYDRGNDTIGLRTRS